MTEFQGGIDILVGEHLLDRQFRAGGPTRKSAAAAYVDKINEIAARKAESGAFDDAIATLKRALPVAPVVSAEARPQLLAQIADLAIEYKTGARSLRGIFEELLTPILYVVPDQPDIRKVTIGSLFTEPTISRGAPTR